MNAQGVVSLVGLVCAFGSAALQAGDEPPPGTRVRIQAGESRTGVLVARDAEQLTLQVGGKEPPVIIPLRQVTGLEVSHGRGRRKAAGIGALVGLVAAGTLVLSGASGVGCGPDDSECFCSGQGCVEAFLLIGVPAAALGAATGALVAPERWREVPVHAAGAASVSLANGGVSVGIVPVRGGVGLSATCSF